MSTIQLTMDNGSCLQSVYIILRHWLQPSLCIRNRHSHAETHGINK